MESLTAKPLRDDQSLRARQMALLRGRRLQAFGGFALACSFVLPAVRECGTTIVPADYAYEVLSKGSHSLPAPLLWGEVFLKYFAPYVYGFVTLVIALRSRKTTEGNQAKESRSVAVLFGVGVVFFLPLMVYNSIEALRLGTSIYRGDFDLAVVGLFSSAYWVHCLACGAGGLLAIRCLASVCCTAWFGLYVTVYDTLYGFWVSLCGSVFILIGCFLEAKVRSQRTAWSTLTGLARGRVQAFVTDRRCCSYCGYLLVGLRTPRCPECGRTFIWEEHGLKPAQTGDEADGLY
jgi:hypothetical protein